MGRYQLRRHDSVAKYREECSSWLARNEVANNEIISAIQLIESGRTLSNCNNYLTTIHAASGISGCAIQVAPDSLNVSKLPPGVTKSLLLDRLTFDVPINWISASEETASRLQKCWEGDLGRIWTPMTRWLIHSLAKTNETVPSSAGLLRLADQSDKALIEEWGNRYALESTSRINIPKFLLRKIDESCLFIWDDKGAKTAVAVSGRTSNVVRISAVYTPNEFRGRGYAKSGVANVCDRFFSDGIKQCILATNDQKPEIARLYESIGFQVVAARVSAAVEG